MAIPTYDELLRPILELALREEITRKSATAAMIRQMGLSEEEAKSRIPSGATTYIHNRTGWAMSHLYKGGLISKVAKHTYRGTDKAREFLGSHQGPITPSDLKKIEGWKEAWDAASKKNAAAKETKHPVETGGGSGHGRGPDHRLPLTTSL